MSLFVYGAAPLHRCTPLHQGLLPAGSAARRDRYLDVTLVLVGCTTGHGIIAPCRVVETIPDVSKDRPAAQYLLPDQG